MLESLAGELKLNFTLEAQSTNPTGVGNVTVDNMHSHANVQKGRMVTFVPKLVPHPSGTGEVVVATDVVPLQIGTEATGGHAATAQLAGGVMAASSHAASAVAAAVARAKLAAASAKSAADSLEDQEPDTPPNELADESGGSSPQNPAFSSGTALLRSHGTHDTLQLGWAGDTYSLELDNDRQELQRLQHQQAQCGTGAVEADSDTVASLSEEHGQADKPTKRRRWPASEFKYIVATESWAGRKDEQEDRHAEEPFPGFGARLSVVGLSGCRARAAFVTVCLSFCAGQSYAVYDGHSGTACADYLTRHLQKSVYASLKWKATQEQARADARFQRMQQRQQTASESSTGAPYGELVVLEPADVTAAIHKVFEEVDARFLDKAKKAR